MRKMLFLFFPLIIPAIVFTQTIKGVVLDAQTHQALAGASVQLLVHSHIGMATGKNGAFSLSAEDIFSDTLLVSYTGYYLQKISLSSENTSYKVLLKPIENNLEEVTITADRKTTFATLNKFGFARQNPFSFERQVAQYFEAPRIGTHLLEIKIAHSYQLYWYGENRCRPVIYSVKFRLHIYSADTLTGIPGKDLIENGIDVTDKGRQNMVIDLSSYDIQLPQKGFYISIEKKVIPSNTYHTMKYYRKEFFIKDIKTEPDIDLIPIKNNMPSGVWIKNKLNAWEKEELGSNVLAISVSIKY